MSHLRKNDAPVCSPTTSDPRLLQWSTTNYSWPSIWARSIPLNLIQISLLSYLLHQSIIVWEAYFQESFLYQLAQPQWRESFRTVVWSWSHIGPECLIVCWKHWCIWNATNLVNISMALCHDIQSCSFIRARKTNDFTFFSMLRWSSTACLLLTWLDSYDLFHDKIAD